MFRWKEDVTTRKDGAFKFDGVPTMGDVTFILKHKQYEEFWYHEPVKAGTLNKFAFEMKRDGHGTRTHE